MARGFFGPLADEFGIESVSRRSNIWYGEKIIYDTLLESIMAAVCEAVERQAQTKTTPSEEGGRKTMMSEKPEQPLFVKIAPGVHRMNSTRIGTIDITLPAPSRAGERYGLLPTNQPVVVNGTWKIEPGDSKVFVGVRAELGYLYWAEDSAPRPPASPPPTSGTAPTAPTEDRSRSDLG